MAPEKRFGGSLQADELSIIIVLAGYENSYGGSASKLPSVWGHAWSLPDEAAPTLDGTIVGTGSQWHGYQMFGEHHAIVSRPSDHTATIGLVAHEMGHAFGFLPDLYDTDGTSDGIGRWGVMGFGAAARLDLRRVGREWHGPCPRRGGANRFWVRPADEIISERTRDKMAAVRHKGTGSRQSHRRPRACSSGGCRKCRNRCRRQRVREVGRSGRRTRGLEARAQGHPHRGLQLAPETDRGQGAVQGDAEVQGRRAGVPCGRRHGAPDVIEDCQTCARATSWPPARTQDALGGPDKSVELRMQSYVNVGFTNLNSVYVDAYFWKCPHPKRPGISNGRGPQSSAYR